MKSYWKEENERLRRGLAALGVRSPIEPAVNDMPGATEEERENERLRRENEKIKKCNGLWTQPRGECGSLEPERQFLPATECRGSHYQVSIAEVAETVCRVIDSFSAPPDARAESKRRTMALFNSPGCSVTDDADACMDRFVEAELDYAAPGDRGLGRITSDIPRLAGKHRDLVSRMTVSARKDLGTVIKRHITCGYLSALFIHRTGKVPTKREQLFTAWVRRMYCWPFELVPKEQVPGVNGTVDRSRELQQVATMELARDTRLHW